MIVVNIALSSPSFNHLMGTLKPQSNGQLYNNTAIGTLAVDGWAVTFGTARSGLGGLGPHPVPSSLYQIKSRPPTASVPTSYYPTITLPVPIKWLRSITMSHTTVYVVPSSTQLMRRPRVLLLLLLLHVAYCIRLMMQNELGILITRYCRLWVVFLGATCGSVRPSVCGWILKNGQMYFKYRPKCVFFSAL